MVAEYFGFIYNKLTLTVFGRFTKFMYAKIKLRYVQCVTLLTSLHSEQFHYFVKLFLNIATFPTQQFWTDSQLCPEKR